MRAILDFLDQSGKREQYVEPVEPWRIAADGKKVARRRFEDNERIVTFRDYGEPVSYKLAPELYDSLKTSQGRPIMPRVIDTLLAGPKRMATLGYTGLNIGFQTVTNPIRDFFTSGMQSQDPGWFMTKHFIRTLQGNFGRIGKGEKAQKAKESFSRYKTSGATAAGPLEADIRSARAFADMFIARASGSGAIPKQLIGHPIETMRTLFSWSEDVNRFPEWQLMEKLYGPGTREANLRGQTAAADVSLDFMRMGEYSRWANEFVPFFNASIQGMDKFARTIKERPVVAIRNAAVNITAPMMALWAINKDEEWYQEIPTWEKTIFAHFKVGDKIIRMPLPFEWGILFGSFPVALMDAEYQKDPKRLKDGVDQMIKTMMPEVWPQALKPIAEIEANKDFFRGTQLESRGMQHLQPEQRYRESTPVIYKAIGKATGTSPVKAQHLAEGYTGGLSKQVTDVVDIMAGQGEQSEKLPLVGRIFSSQTRQGQSVADFYDNYDAMQQAWSSAKKRREEGDVIAARRILEDSADLLGLSKSEIAILTRKRKWDSRPRKLQKYSKMADRMSRLRKSGADNKQLTSLARLALGR
jgi:hypothetical protein